ncbi:MAG: hypothetical protein KDA86_15065 [Planctomycetaceae bacterium]|nr:hypothetical protein [Planctomycetaceae bacterium]
MSDAKKSRRKAKAAPKPESRPSRVARILGVLWQPFPLLTTALALSAVMFWPEIVRQLPDLRDRPEYQLSWSRITTSPAGRWVPPDLVSQVQKRSGLPDPLPMLDEGLVEKLSFAFARHPWVAEVQSVAKTGPQDIIVKMRFRAPVLMVRTRYGLYPVDREGILLPPSDFAASDAERFPVVDQVRSVPSGPAGTTWGDESVHGAARLAEALTSEGSRTSSWESFGMAKISVLAPNQPATSMDEVTLEITTNDHSQIVWGRPPGADALEPTVEQKLLRLEKHLPRYGETGWSSSPVRLDVRWWDVIDKVELSQETEAQNH